MSVAVSVNYSFNEYFIICIWILSWQDKIVMKQCKISSQSHPHFDYRYFHGILSISSFTFQSYYIGPILSIIHMNNMNSQWHKNPSLMFVKKLNISVIILFTLFQSNISQHQCIEFNFVEFVDALALTRILGSGSLSVTQAISKGVFS